MMRLNELQKNIELKNTCLCLGLDTDIEKVPPHLNKYSDPVFEFNKSLIDRLNNKIVAVKINTAFYEANGTEGWSSLIKTVDYINHNHPDLFTIADAKRADIGNTSNMYAKAFFEKLNFDSITISPYMGKDSVSQFLKYENKYVILLALTSNEGSNDFQIPNDLYLNVIAKSQDWEQSNKLMYVVGATKDDYFEKIRALIPESFLLIPGVGSQGGDINKVLKNLTKTSKNILINVSRAIIYASSSKEYLDAAEKSVDYFNSQIDFK
jgi:orotidine-5'-phosphate decarboxylase